MRSESIRLTFSVLSSRLTSLYHSFLVPDGGLGLKDLPHPADIFARGVPLDQKTVSAMLLLATHQPRSRWVFLLLDLTK